MCATPAGTSHSPSVASGPLGDATQPVSLQAQEKKQTEKHQIKKKKKKKPRSNASGQLTAPDCSAQPQDGTSFESAQAASSSSSSSSSSSPPDETRAPGDIPTGTPKERPQKRNQEWKRRGGEGTVGREDAARSTRAAPPNFLLPPATHHRPRSISAHFRHRFSLFPFSPCRLTLPSTLRRRALCRGQYTVDSPPDAHDESTGPPRRRTYGVLV